MRHNTKKRPREPKQSTKEKLKTIKKERKLKLKEKRARLIIRNLPFHTTEDDLKELFGKYGDIADIKILKKEDGQLVGCGFVQFKLVQKAAKARHHTNGKPLLGRNITVDFALAKNKFEATVPEVNQVDEVKVKEEPIDEAEVVKEEEKVVEEEEVKQDEEEEVKEDEEEEVKDEEEEAIEDDEEGGSEEQEESDDVVEVENKKYESNDVTEGKTVFVRNIPFSATNNDLKECMKQFGPVYYALICIDKFTEHSKGTGFVKFVNQEDAEKALSAGTELTLHGNVLDCHKALGRQEVQQKSTSKKEAKTTPKDSRNLYLVKEGVILAGSKAAEGVSATDMAKRLQLEQYKTQMLRKLNMFVARERLVVHNLPPTWDDSKLKALIKNNSPNGTVIREARIMRDLKDVDAQGIGRSKEFGFVTVARHEDALAVLRNLNNNPNIFTSQRRPILAFSIENKSMIKAKQKRLEKSQLKNPHCKRYDPNIVKVDREKWENRNKEKQEDGEVKPFVGVAAKPGVQKMRSRYNLKTQAKLHHENLKKEKKKQKFAKKSFQAKKQDFIKQPKQKVNRKVKNDVVFAKMVSNYKKTLLEASYKKNKWYEEG